MEYKLIRKRILVFLILFATLSGCGTEGSNSDENAHIFSEIVNGEDLSGLSLTIYYADPFLLTVGPLNTNDLTKDNVEYCDVIHVSDLDKHSQVLIELSNMELSPIETQTFVDARIYYAFEQENVGKVLEVVMWGEKDSIFVNDIEVKGNDVFYKVIMPFLSEAQAEALNAYINKWR